MSEQQPGPGARPGAYAARVSDLVGQIEAIGARLDRSLRSEPDVRAEAARRGELGPDWRTVQQRIDAGRTSLEAVFGGEDESPAAQALRTISRRTLAGLARARDDSPGGAQDDLADAFEAVRTARERFERSAGPFPDGRPGAGAP
ncbi:hypothetical protein [Cellulomonas chengniuliangii]|uniref:Uncharacterized protein n=1 Tax=Cellulomonas chengniuliangii TaxID=2968084 RepID=A0ABY5KXA5_9CELL|nr:hypothetical protein [Cellulomonas chengniuliangii]MCC2309385.1 hypothetical protein [Cellulomonas chengniuliangii]MCC2316656.1 hypothetical protein [Cellulomonas chengniuliangii]UUI75049.1 hypothetical protein NP064_14915 [Cellulomonas chengniuliangii]